MIANNLALCFFKIWLSKFGAPNLAQKRERSWQMERQISPKTVIIWIPKQSGIQVIRYWSGECLPNHVIFCHKLN